MNASAASPKVAVALLLFGAGAVRGQTTNARLEGSNVTWDLDAKTAKIDTHLGRPSLFLRGQSPPAFVSNLEFTRTGPSSSICRHSRVTLPPKWP